MYDCPLSSKMKKLSPEMEQPSLIHETDMIVICKTVMEIFHGPYRGVGALLPFLASHLSRVKLETTATFDLKADEFVIHSLTLTFDKWWPGQSSKISTHVVIHAWLIPYDQEQGMHGFIVLPRSLDDRLPLSRRTIGDIGMEFGNGTYDTRDNGVVDLTMYKSYESLGCCGRKLMFPALEVEAMQFDEYLVDRVTLTHAGTCTIQREATVAPPISIQSKLDVQLSGWYVRPLHSGHGFESRVLPVILKLLTYDPRMILIDPETKITTQGLAQVAISIRAYAGSWFRRSL
ncbi:hypothetical protein VNO77_04374 [Canavalia gladiata]|uniref:Uncharacterized protein n=1 Tax=Canavalia gladiata TaxID=3824 RepID=A0AAN9MWG3_CANGL